MTLADVPTDVLVFLVDHGPTATEAVFEALAPSGVAEHLTGSVARALHLLGEIGWAHKLAPGSAWCATVEGRRAVVEARARQAAAS